MAALALMDEPEAPSFLTAYLDNAIAGVRSSVPGFAPDGEFFQFLVCYVA